MHEQVVHELRKRQEAEQQALVCEAAPEEADTAYQRALEASRHHAAPRPTEAFGFEGMSQAAARRKVRRSEALLSCSSAAILG
jgi:hypothetical protein